MRAGNASFFRLTEILNQHDLRLLPARLVKHYALPIMRCTEPKRHGLYFAEFRDCALRCVVQADPRSALSRRAREDYSSIHDRPARPTERLQLLRHQPLRAAINGNLPDLRIG